MAKKINVLVICGGPSNERSVSLKTGAEILKALPSKYNGRLLEISGDGRWLFKESQPRIASRKGTSRELLPQEKHALRAFDVAFIGMHGKFG